MNGATHEPVLRVEAQRSGGETSFIWADDGYKGKLLKWIKEKRGWAPAIVRRADGVTGFQALPSHWVLEQGFGWGGGIVG